jgi:hypothetical protein
MSRLFFSLFFFYFVFLLEQSPDFAGHMTHWVWFTHLLAYAYLLMLVMDRLILLTHQ